MISHLIFYPLTLIALVWLFLMLHWLWRSAYTSARLTTAQPIPPSRKRTKGPKPFPGLTRQPHCAACEQDGTLRREPPCAPPPQLVFIRGRRRQVDTSHHFCPEPDCRYGGWTGLGNISANGHPSGGPWRQLHCSRCGGYFLETHGTPLHGKRVAPELLVWAVGALAEGLGIRAVARVFEVDPNTVLQWLVEAADHLEAFSQYFLHDVHVTQVQLDELFALLSAVKAGESMMHEALQRLSRSPHWVWVAMDPVTKVLLASTSGIGLWPWPRVWSIRWSRCWRPAVCPSSSPTVTRSTPPRSSPISASGCSRYAARTKGHTPSRAGCRCPVTVCPGGEDRAAAASGPRAHRVVFGTLEAVEQVLASMRLADQHRRSLSA